MSDKIYLKEITLPIVETGENETYSFVQTDDGLDTPGDAADSKETGDRLNSLKQDFNQSEISDFPLVKKELEHIVSDNLFDKSKAVAGTFDSNGDIISSDNSSITDYIKVTAGDTLKFWYVVNGTVYSANMGRVNTYSENKTLLASSSVSSGTYTVPSNVEYIRFSMSNIVVSTGMLINSETKPDTYIEYYDYYVATTDFVEKALKAYGVVKSPVEKDDTDFWTEIISENLFNQNDVINGEYFNYNGTISTSSSMFRSYVKINGSGDYCLDVPGAFFGLANSCKIPTFDKDKNFVKTITGTTEDTVGGYHNKIVITISSADISDGVYYIGYSQQKSVVANVMVVKSDEYPSEYVSYFHGWSIPGTIPYISNNPMFRKVAIFDGDSICAGNGSALGDYGNGWAGRIGVYNGMTAINVGVSGGTITAETYTSNNTARHWVSRYIDTIYANYPDADYIILEGGTNDADNFYGDDTKLGTFSESDFTGPFDDTKFYGAMDSLCKKALTYFPKAKIGFIIPQKMGTGLTTYTKNRRDYFDYAKAVCKKWGIPVIDLWDEGQLRPDLTSMYDPQYNTIETATEHEMPYYDTQHLTAYGYDVLSPRIDAWMKSM